MKVLRGIKSKYKSTTKDHKIINKEALVLYLHVFCVCANLYH